VTTPARHRYAIDLLARKGEDGARAIQTEGEDRARIWVLRTIKPDDAGALARLMLEAYRGTIDSEDETLDDAIAEIDSYFDANPMLDSSFLIERDGNLVSAVLVSLIDEGPFVSYVITVPAHKNKGFGGRVTAAALDSLGARGHDEVAFYITVGNTPSEALFTRLGAVVDPDG